jgi:alkylation response protein AidB-like acyl-CoA dehydrogenase
MHGLSDADLALQAAAARVRRRADPPRGRRRAGRGRAPHRRTGQPCRRARALGLTATNIPVEHGGRGCTTLQQVLVQEQGGRVTNALAWVMTTPPGWLPAVATPFQRDRWLGPTVRGDAVECYAITEEHAGSDVVDLAATARRDGDDYLLDGEKWHVTSFNEATYAFFQARLVDGDHAGEHAMFFVDLPDPGRAGRAHPRVLALDRAPPPDRRPSRACGCRPRTWSAPRATDDVRARVVPVRAADGGSAVRGCCRPPGRGGTRVRPQRQVGGQALADYQMVQAMLADSVTELFAARSMLYATARAIDDGLDRKAAHAACSMAKLYASEMAGRVADRAVQVFGGRGLHARERGRAVLPRAAGRAHLGGRQRGAAA